LPKSDRGFQPIKAGHVLIERDESTAALLKTLSLRAARRMMT